MDKYLKLGYLGKGYYGSVNLVKNLENNELYAMKTIGINIGLLDLNMIFKEIEIMKTFNHKNIVKYYDSFIHKKTKLCIILEYADNGDLNKFVNKYISEGKIIPEDLIWEFFFQIVDALDYLHKRKIIHRDIKSHNIFLTKNNLVKLGDFGLSKVLENSMDFAKSSLGTPYYLSPEICQGKPYKYASDIWMLGCLLYELACLSKPFEAKTLPDLMKKIIECEYSQINQVYSEQLREVIQKCLNKNPDKRPSIRDLMKNEKLMEIKKEFLNKNKPLSFLPSKKNILKNSLAINTSIINDTSPEIKINNIKCPKEKKDIKNVFQIKSNSENIENKINTQQSENSVSSSLNKQQSKNPSTPNFILKRKKTENTSPILNFEKENDFNYINRSIIKSKFASAKNVLYNNPLIQKSKCSQISINISSVQTPKNKPEYCVENIEVKNKKSCFSKYNKTDLNDIERIIEKYQSKIENEELSISPYNENSFKFSRNLMKNYIRYLTGPEIYDKIIQIIELEEIPENFISSEYLRDLCSFNYTKVAKSLRLIYLANLSPISISTTSGKSTTSHTGNNC